MAKWSSAAIDSYVEAMRRRYGTHDTIVGAMQCAGHEAFKPGEQVRIVNCGQFDGLYVIAPNGEMSQIYQGSETRQMREEVAVAVETKRPEIFVHDPDEPERLRRVFASWDFRNGT